MLTADIKMEIFDNVDFHKFETKELVKVFVMIDLDGYPCLPKRQVPRCLMQVKWYKTETGTIHCLVELNNFASNNHLFGHGIAGGSRYSKYSASFQDALDSMTITLSERIAVAGVQKVEEVMLAIARDIQGCNNIHIEHIYIYS